jgi:hypothetical protein
VIDHHGLATAAMLDGPNVIKNLSVLTNRDTWNDQISESSNVKTISQPILDPILAGDRDPAPGYESDT